MPTYTLLEYNDNYSKTTGNFWEYCKDIPAVYTKDMAAGNNDGVIVNFNVNNVTDFLNFQEKITWKTRNDETKDIEIFGELLKCL